MTTDTKANKVRDLPTIHRTLVGFILDESGSMSNVRDATIDGFNEYVTGLKAKNSDAISLTLVKFNSDSIDTVYNDIVINKIDELDDCTYMPAAATPLYDAIAKGIRSIEKKRKKALEACDACNDRFQCFTQGVKDDCESRPSVLFIVMTDGMENASKQYDKDKILKMIQKKEKEGWTFAYLGANQDAWSVGTSFGLRGGNTMTFDSSTDSGMIAAYSHAITATNTYLAKKNKR